MVIGRLMGLRPAAQCNPQEISCTSTGSFTVEVLRDDLQFVRARKLLEQEERRQLFGRVASWAGDGSLGEHKTG